MHISYYNIVLAIIIHLYMNDSYKNFLCFKLKFNMLSKKEDSGGKKG